MNNPMAFAISAPNKGIFLTFPDSMGGISVFHIQEQFQAQNRTPAVGKTDRF